MNNQDIINHLNRRRFLGVGVATGLAGSFWDLSAFAYGAGNITHTHNDWPTDGCLLCAMSSGNFSTKQLSGQLDKTPSASILAATSFQEDKSRGGDIYHPQHEKETIIIQPSWVLVPKNGKLSILDDHDVVIKGDLIEEIRPRRSGTDKRIVAEGQFLLPGFISGHSHCAAGTVTRGFIEETSLAAIKGEGNVPRARSLLRPMVLMDELDDSELDALTALNLAEMLRTGCTTQVEMSLSLKQMKSYVRVASRFGIRGYPSAGVPGMRRLMSIWVRSNDQVLDDSIPETLKEIRESLEYAETINGTENGRIRPMMCPIVTAAHTQETFDLICKAAIRLGNGIQTHVQNDWRKRGRAALQRVWGKREIETIQHVGLLDVKLFGAHLLGIDIENDLPILANKNFTFAHCPSAAGAGVLPSSQPYPEALAAGVNTSIGFDTHSNDYLENIKLAVMQGRARAQLLQKTSPVPLIEPTMWHALESATLGGARGLGRMDLGRIEAGAKADLCTVDVSGLLIGSGTRALEPYNNLLYANGLAVRNVMTDGNWQLRGGRIIFADENELIKHGGVVAKKIWTQLEKEGFFKRISE